MCSRMSNMLSSTMNFLSCSFLIYGLYGITIEAAVLGHSSDMKQSDHVASHAGKIHHRMKRQEDEKQFDITQFINHVRYGVIDFACIMDRSWGMGKRDFYLQEKKVLRSIIEQYLLLHPSFVHLSVITFAKDVEVPIDNITPSAQNVLTKAELFEGSNPPWEQVLFKQDPEISKGTYVHLAIRKANEILTAGEALNRNAAKVLLIITDGDYKPENDSVTLDEVEKLRKNGIIVFTISLGSWMKIANVRQLATVDIYHGNINDWKASLYQDGNMRRASADSPPIWTTLPEDKDIEYCGRPCTNGRCETDAITGRTECRCNPGYTLDINGNCAACSYHRYKNTVGNEACKDCATTIGYGTITQGADSPDKCQCQSVNCIGTTCSMLQCDPNLHKHCEHVNGMEATCVCDKGFVDDGFGTCINEDNCANVFEPCQNEGICLDSVDTYTCVCKWGSYGSFCEKRVDECSHKQYGQPLCENNGTCIHENFRNDFNCECLEGYDGFFCQNQKTTTTTTTTPVPDVVITTTRDPVLQEMFDRFDNNSDDQITMKEMMDASESMGTILTEDQANETFSSLDINGGGLVDYEEFQTIVLICQKGKDFADLDEEMLQAISCFITPSKASTGGEDDNKDLLIIIIASSLGGLLFIIVIIVVACYICSVRRKKKREQEQKLHDELDNQLRRKTASGRYTKRQRKMPKTISQKFSGFWKKLTVRGGAWNEGDIATEGTPSAPPKRRPDLLDATGTPNFEMHVVDEVCVGNTVIEDPGSMMGWKSYLADLETSGMIKSGTIANMDGAKAAMTSDYVENNDEIDELLDIINNKQVDVQVTIQKLEYEVKENNGTILKATSEQDSLNAVVARTRTYVVVLISSDDISLDKLTKEAQFITDHISSEGY